MHIPGWRLWAVLLCIYVALHGLWTVFHWGGADLASKIFVLPALVPVAAATLAATWRTRRELNLQLQRGWTTLAAALWVYLLGWVVWVFYVIRQGYIPFPTIADPLFLAFPWLVFLAVKQLTGSQLRAENRARVGLNTLIVVCALGLIEWSLLLRHAVAIAETPLAALAAVAYPLGDLVMLGGAAFALQHAWTPERRAFLVPLLAAIGLLLFGNLVYAVQIVTGTYQPASPLDVVWSLAMLFFALAAFQPIPTTPVPMIVQARGERFSSSIILPLKLAAYASLLPIMLTTQRLLDTLVALTLLLTMGVLIHLRHRLDIRDNVRLNANLKDANTHLEQRVREAVATLEERNSTLAESEARTRAIVNTIPDLLMTVSEAGVIRTYKPLHMESDPTWVKNMPGRQVKDAFPRPLADLLMRHVYETVQDGSPRCADVTVNLADVDPSLKGMVDLEASSARVGDDEVLVIARDVTERKRVERLKSEFVSTVSHELRTPLTSICGSLSLMAGGVLGELPPRGKKMVDVALKNSERLVRLINDLLDIEKIESGKLEFHFGRVDLNTLITRATEDNGAYAQQFGVKLDRQRPVSEAWVWGDADRLVQVLTNLISNAVKFSPKDGTVTVALEQQGGHLRVSVRDRGPGVPQEFRSRIFQRFAQADSADTRQQGGTGLGLSISKAIVERHDGHLGFEDHPEGGTVFWFDLPAHNPPQAAPSPGAGERRVLVCEDDPDVAHLLQLILQGADIHVDVSYNAEEAEQRLRERQYDALVLDLLLPGKDGLTLIRELRQAQETATLPIVVVSAVADEQKAKLNGDAVHVADWIRKPIDTQQLLSAVRLAARHADLQTLRVLHVEDDPDVRTVVSEVLHSVVSVTRAGTVAQARDVLRQQPFDLVLLDLSLPDGNGMDLLPELRAKQPTLPVVVFSASELDRKDLERVSAALLKSRTSNGQLLATIQGLLPQKVRP